MVTTHAIDTDRDKKWDPPQSEIKIILSPWNGGASTVHLFTSPNLINYIFIRFNDSIAFWQFSKSFFLLSTTLWELAGGGGRGRSDLFLRVDDISMIQLACRIGFILEKIGFILARRWYIDDTVGAKNSIFYTFAAKKNGKICLIYYSSRMVGGRVREGMPLYCLLSG